MRLVKYPGNVPVSRVSAPWSLQRWQREINQLLGDPFEDWLMPEEPFCPKTGEATRQPIEVKVE